MKKIGIIILAVLIALGAMGAGYAAWSQNFNVTTSVSTGSYIVKITQTPAATMANDSNPSFPFTATGTLTTTSGTTVTVSDNSTVAQATIGPLTTNGASAGFSVTIANGYPGLILRVPYVVTSSGTVPATITGMQLGTLGGGLATWDGTSTTIQLSGGTTTDVTVKNTTNGTTLLNLAGSSLGTAKSGVLVITIPDALTGLTDAGGLNGGGVTATPLAVPTAQTLNFEIDTTQTP